MVFCLAKFRALVGISRHFKVVCAESFNFCRRRASSCASLSDIGNYLKQFGGGSVELEKDEKYGIAVITLNNAGKHNALTGKMMVELSDRISELEKWHNGKGLILRGAAGTFCSGGDLDFMREINTGEEGYKMATFMHDIMLRCRRLPMISVALIEGRALGGGAEISLSCDFRIMTEFAKIGFVHIKLNVTPGFGAATFLTRLLGPAKALDLLASGTILDASSAKDLGLVHSTLSDGPEVLEVSEQWLISRYCIHEPSIIKSLKTIIIKSEESRYKDALEFEKRVFEMNWFAPLHEQAMKRKKKHD